MFVDFAHIKPKLLESIHFQSILWSNLSTWLRSLWLLRIDLLKFQQLFFGLVAHVHKWGPTRHDYWVKGILSKLNLELRIDLRPLPKRWLSPFALLEIDPILYVIVCFKDLLCWLVVLDATLISTLNLLKDRVKFLTLLWEGACNWWVHIILAGKITRPRRYLLNFDWFFERVFHFKQWGCSFSYESWITVVVELGHCARSMISSIRRLKSLFRSSESTHWLLFNTQGLLIDRVSIQSSVKRKIWGIAGLIEVYGHSGWVLVLERLKLLIQAIDINSIIIREVEASLHLSREYGGKILCRDRLLLLKRACLSSLP